MSITAGAAIAYIPNKARKWDPNGPYQPPDLPPNWKEWALSGPRNSGWCDDAERDKAQRR